MRVIAGRFRGRQLVSFKADHIRPTTDRVKESIFKKLQHDIPEARVLDLFSGTGNLAIEALSRGASHVTAVEMSKKSLAILRENLEKLDIRREIEVVADDVLKYIRKHSGPAYNVILVDPPFTEKMADEVLQALSESASRGDALIGSETVIVIESSKHETVREEYDALERFDGRDYGDKLLTYFRRKGL
jgi:16S rRNA (guanine966-N2)-methyltransferase